MKAKVKYTAVALLVAGSIFTSCEKSDLVPATPDGVTMNDESKAYVRYGIVGKWKVLKYKESGLDQTRQFDGYEFDFREGGRLVVTNGFRTSYGSWSHRVGDLNDPLVIDLGRRMPFADLTDKWIMVTASGTRLEMTTGSGTRMDNLVFER